MHYEKYETDISENYLKKILSTFPGTVLLGGWAVYLLVNNNFKEARGRNYSGSRDIDIGLHIDAKWSTDQLKNSIFPGLVHHLEKDGFEWQGFRMFKNYHTETAKELTPEESKTLFAPSIFPLYIDIIVDFIHPRFSDTFGFVPIDEPLLKYFFENEKLRKNIRFYGANLVLPTPELLLAMKLNSLPARDKEHKKIKDISDIFALLFFSGRNLSSIKQGLTSFYEPKKVTSAVKNITDREIHSVAGALGFEFSEIKRVLIELAK